MLGAFSVSMTEEKNKTLKSILFAVFHKVKLKRYCDGITENSHVTQRKQTTQHGQNTSP